MHTLISIIIVLILTTPAIADTLTIEGRDCRCEHGSDNSIVVQCDGELQITARQHRTLEQRLNKWVKERQKD